MKLKLTELHKIVNQYLFEISEEEFKEKSQVGAESRRSKNISLMTYVKSISDEVITEIAEIVIYFMTRQDRVQNLFPGVKEGESAFGKGWAFNKERIDIELIKRLVKSELFRFSVPVSKAGIDGESVDITLSYKKVDEYIKKLTEKEKEKWSNVAISLSRKNVEVYGKPHRLPGAVGYWYDMSYDDDYYQKVYDYYKDMSKVDEAIEKYEKAVTHAVLSDENVIRPMVRLVMLTAGSFQQVFSIYARDTRVGLLKDKRKAEKSTYVKAMKDKLKDWFVIHYPYAYTNRGSDTFTDALDFLRATAGKRSRDELPGVAYHKDNNFLGDSLADAQYSKIEKPSVGVILDGFITSIFKQDVGSTMFDSGYTIGGKRGSSGFARYAKDSGNELKDMLQKMSQTGVDDYIPGAADSYLLDLEGYAEQVKGKSFAYNEAFIDNWTPKAVIARWGLAGDWTVNNVNLINKEKAIASLESFYNEVSGLGFTLFDENFQPIGKEQFQAYADNIIAQLKNK